MTTIASSLRSGATAVTSSKRSGARTLDDWGDVRVGLFRESGKRPLHTGGLCRSDQLLHQERPFAGRVEGGDGARLEPRRDGRSNAGADRDLIRPCWSSVCLADQPHLWLFYFSAAFGYRSLVPRGSGNCWFRCSHRLGIAIGGAGRRWGVDAWLSQRWPSSLFW
jgi:hypothetical protein